MGKNKLEKFADMESYPHVFQPQVTYTAQQPSPMQGQWHAFFGNDNPIVLELGCGRGEYSVGLAQRFPHKNFIGVDIKGARMWSGATESLQLGLKNVAFLRCNIELIALIFAPGEVSEVWLTFPDPQMKKITKRLTSTGFMQRYRRIMRDGGTVHLKTDSNFLYTYTTLMVQKNALPVDFATDDLYGLNSSRAGLALDIKTAYERQWLQRGLTIKYLRFALPAQGELAEPDVEIELDDYRSYNRSKRSSLSTSK